MSAESVEARLVEEIAGGAWVRLRNLIGALDRVDRLETSSEFVGWLQGLAADGPGLAETIREFLLRALRLACDPANSRLLVHIDHAGATAIGELAQEMGVGRVELVERLNELARAGLTVQALDAEQVEVTPFARGFLSLVDEITGQMKTLADGDYLLNPRGQLPRIPSGPTGIHKLNPKI